MLEILTYPDKRLRQKALPVLQVNEKIQRLVDDMAATMYAAPGVGLAATQVGQPVRVVVIDIDYTDGKPNLIELINPEIVARDGEIVWEEGCLSFPEIHEDVKRSANVTVRALDRSGRPIEIAATGLLAVAMQHEIDHLDGVLLIDQVSFLKRQIIARQLKRTRKNG